MYQHILQGCFGFPRNLVYLSSMNASVMSRRYKDDVMSYRGKIPASIPGNYSDKKIIKNGFTSAVESDFSSSFRSFLVYSLLFIPCNF